jgi:hypothetical protein
LGGTNRPLGHALNLEIRNVPFFVWRQKKHLFTRAMAHEYKKIMDLDERVARYLSAPSSFSCAERAQLTADLDYNRMLSDELPEQFTSKEKKLIEDQIQACARADEQFNKLIKHLAPHIATISPEDYKWIEGYLEFITRMFRKKPHQPDIQWHGMGGTPASKKLLILVLEAGGYQINARGDPLVKNPVDDWLTTNLWLCRVSQPRMPPMQPTACSLPL